MTDFKVGDRVRVRQDTKGFEGREGRVVRVVTPAARDKFPVRVELVGGGSRWSFAASELEPIGVGS